jgi:GTP cyclohydrolase IB
MNKEKLEKLKKALPDVQQTRPRNQIPIDKVGVRDIKVPIGIYGAAGEQVNTVATISAYSHLSEEYKGVSMSRFSEIIHEAVEKDASVEIIYEILEQIQKRLGGKDSYIKMKFDYFIKKEAPVSKIKSYFYVPCVLEGRSVGGVRKVYLTTTTYYQSACPCSKEISKFNTHNQRSFARVTVELNDIVSIEDFVSLVESQASCPINNLLKRPDEKYVTEKVYSNPKFVEDMARDIASKLKVMLNNNNINDYVVVIEHEESIHQYNAVAVISAGKVLK